MASKTLRPDQHRPQNGQDKHLAAVAPLPGLPKPLPKAVLESLIAPVTDLSALRDQHERIQTSLLHSQEQIDILKLAIEQNHADFIARRPSWSYDDRLQVEWRLKTVIRQRQSLQICFGKINREVKKHAHRENLAISEQQFSSAFMLAAQALLDAETYAMLMDLAKAQVHCKEA
jgi:hypothetical protein